MASESASDVKLEIGHVLFIDIVGYSKLLIDDQRELQEELNRIVRGTEQFRAAESAGKLVRLPTGDGMALVFFTTPEAPILCALEISEALQGNARMRLRMGIHTGPVSGVTDVNDKSNIAGGGINMAQRVMDIGDAGHILLSKRAAEDLVQYRKWEAHLHDLGEFEVKHGATIPIVNLYTATLGNSQIPEKLNQFSRKRASSRHLKQALIATLVVLVIAFPVGAFLFLRRTPPRFLGATIPEKSIAVLPFENLSEDKANAYFAEGIQDEILTRLAKIADLKVISRTSTQTYKSSPRNLSEIATQLGVAKILEGSVQKSADQVRVNVQLINARTDSHIWADTYDRKLIDIFVIESEIAKAVADALQAKLTGSEEQALAVKPTNNAEAYDAYLRGLTLEARSSYSPVNIRKTIGFYERAVKLDPAFALAWCKLCRMDGHSYYVEVDATEARRAAAEQALHNAQRLQPNAAETLLAQAYYERDVLGNDELAKATFIRVGKVIPGSSEVHSALAMVLRRQGRWAESVAQFEQALALDPRDIQKLTAAAETYSAQRQFQTALKILDRALDIMPNDPDLLASEAQIYQSEGDLERAEKLLGAVNPQTPSGSTFQTKMTQLVLEQRYDEAIQFLRSAPSESQDVDDQLLDQLVLASVQELAGDTLGARANAQKVRETLEPLCKREPNKIYWPRKLSEAYAILGERDAALKEAMRVITLPLTVRDAAYGPWAEENLAEIQARFGENDAAIAALQHLLKISYVSPITPALLKLDPTWVPLHNDPRFEKLLASSAPKPAESK
jgi:TolB-like protein/class 3 adenylate cyclase/Tfp pilus assembly protein PilF